jgi:hypothetical protein
MMETMIRQALYAVALVFTLVGLIGGVANYGVYANSDKIEATIVGYVSLESKKHRDLLAPVFKTSATDGGRVLRSSISSNIREGNVGDRVEIIVSKRGDAATIAKISNYLTIWIVLFLVGLLTLCIIMFFEKRCAKLCRPLELPSQK